METATAPSFTLTLRHTLESSGVPNSLRKIKLALKMIGLNRRTVIAQV
jgi:hypothetical protein